MKAYVVEQAGGPEVLKLRDIASAAPGADEVRIRVKAFGLNRAEVYRRAGKEVLEDPSRTFRTAQRVATAMGGLQWTPRSDPEEITPDLQLGAST
jgi:NADPH2:quinone reductase